MRQLLIWGCVSVLWAISQASHARQGLAVLDFELNDITSLPNTPEEQRRTAGIRPMLEQVLADSGDYQMIALEAGAQQRANAGFGYLYAHADQAAALGKQAGVDWLIVGQHRKPSFLFSYLNVQVIDTAHAVVAARFNIEMKGTHPSVVRHGVETLAGKIGVFLNDANHRRDALRN